ncbi:Uncharacterized protein SCF082_LOCUS38173, partial [Durusdinium trenchii]
ADPVLFGEEPEELPRQKSSGAAPKVAARRAAPVLFGEEPEELPRQKSSQQCAASVDAFLSLMYNGVAETLPDRFIRRGRSSGQEDSDIDIDSDCEVEELRDFLDVPGKGPVWDIVHPNEKQITKYMDPGTVADLYQHYVATRQMFGAAAVSYGTFLKVYKERWQSILKFREKNLFSACELCWHFKNDIANSKTLEERLGQLVKYRQHLAHQYQDRAICWALQELVLDDQSDLVCIQVDGLDQSKFSLPRDPKLRATSSVPTEKRPRLKIHGAWAFCNSSDKLSHEQSVNLMRVFFVEYFEDIVWRSKSWTTCYAMTAAASQK